MKKRTFEHKGQMINYWNKIRTNTKIKMLTSFFDCNRKTWVIQWIY